MGVELAHGVGALNDELVAAVTGKTQPGTGTSRAGRLDSARRRRASRTRHAGEDPGACFCNCGVPSLCKSTLANAKELR